MRARWRPIVAGVLVSVGLGGALALSVPSLRGLFVLGLYCLPTNSILPLPHEPGVLYAAQLYDPLSIAIVATLASSIVSFADYALVDWALRHPRIGRVQHAPAFRWAVRYMQRWPFWIVVVFSLAPLPISVIRILAPASGYRINRYIVAQAVGRLPRFFLLASLGAWLHIPAWVLVVLTVAGLALFLGPTRSMGSDPVDVRPAD